METTFWKPDPIPATGDLPVKLEPIGNPLVVSRILLDVPGMRPCVTWRSIRGYSSLTWNGAVLSMTEEPEYGPGGAFSILVEGEVWTRDFHRLYVQVFELVGVALLVRGEGFIKPRDFKRRVTEGWDS